MARKFTVEVGNPKTLYRVVRNSDAFLSDEALGLDQGTESFVAFRGISVRATLEHALNLARSMKRGMERAGMDIGPEGVNVPRNVVGFNVGADNRDAWAKTGKTHFTAWCAQQPAGLRVVGIWTIEGERVYPSD
jgi:hypothetical protein